MQYRNDIDGLRAAAIVPILLFHAGVSKLQGGFVGVDIFFVISGFLITSIITRELDAGTFSIATFYKRRAVRILPALALMLVGTLIAGKFLLLAVELRDLGRSAAAAMAFVANIHFWLSVDYFDSGAETKVLLHTWSLGVEEQFYIVYPFFLLLVRRWFPRSTTVAVLLATVLSFALSMYFSRSEPTAAFYLIPMRAWELGMGALVALNALPKIASKHARNAVAVTGAAMVLIAVFKIRPDYAFPAPWALLPCTGAVLLIAYGRDAVTARILAWKPVRAIGLISYSLYLWHWPIITIYRLNYGMEISIGGKVLVIALSFAAATLTYFLVEQPFLRRHRQTRSRPVLIAAGVAVASVAGASLLVSSQAAAIVQHPSAVNLVGSYADYRTKPQHPYQFRGGTCFASKGQQYDRASCLTLQSGRPNVIVMGDSHAAQYWRAITLRFPQVNVVQATASGCRPTLAFKGRDRCTSVMKLVLNDIVRQPKVVGVVLAGRWQEDEVASLVDTVSYLRKRGLAVTVIGPTVEYSVDMPRVLARSMLAGDPYRISALLKRDRFDLDRHMKPLVENAGGQYLSETQFECSKGTCKLFDGDGGPYHFDYGHLTLTASKEVVRRLSSITVR